MNIKIGAKIIFSAIVLVASSASYANGTSYFFPDEILKGDSTTFIWNLPSGTRCSSIYPDSPISFITGRGSRVFYPEESMSITLLCMQNDRPSGYAGGSVKVLESVPQVDVDVSVSPSTANPGDDITVTWSSSNADSCRIEVTDEGVQPNGQAVVELPHYDHPDANTSGGQLNFPIRVKCSNFGDSYTKSATVNYNQNVTPSLNSSVTNFEHHVNLYYGKFSWSSQGAFDCRLLSRDENGDPSDSEYYYAPSVPAGGTITLVYPFDILETIQCKTVTGGFIINQACGYPFNPLACN